MGKPLFGSALVSVFSGWYELLGLISAALSGPVLFVSRLCLACELALLFGRVKRVSRVLARLTSPK